jgi:hypothetical protein
MTKSPGHSTLAYANQHRPWQIYQDLFTALVAHLRAKLPVSAKTPLTVPGQLLSLDSTMVDLCAAVFDWAKYKTTKGAVKIHLLLDHDGLMPHYAVITEGKTSDIAVARTLDLPKGAMVVFDRTRFHARQPQRTEQRSRDEDGTHRYSSFKPTRAARKLIWSTSSSMFLLTLPMPLCPPLVS